MKLGKSTILLIVISTLLVLLYTGIEVFWALSPSVNFTQKKVVKLRDEFDMKVVDEVWGGKEIVKHIY